MKKKMAALLIAAMAFGTVFTSAASCESVKEEETEALSEAGTEADAGETLADGVYLADFDTDNSMFHVNEVCEGKGTLTVKDGEMILHITMPSKNIVNLYLGVVEDAKEDEENWIQPTEDDVTYDDGMEETVFGFDVPVPVIGEEFDLALIGTKGKWYDHKVSVSNPEPAPEEESCTEETCTE